MPDEMNSQCSDFLLEIIRKRLTDRHLETKMAKQLQQVPLPYILLSHLPLWKCPKNLQIWTIFLLPVFVRAQSRHCSALGRDLSQPCLLSQWKVFYPGFGLIYEAILTEVFSGHLLSFIELLQEILWVIMTGLNFLTLFCLKSVWKLLSL